MPLSTTPHHNCKCRDKRAYPLRFWDAENIHAVAFSMGAQESSAAPHVEPEVADENASVTANVEPQQAPRATITLTLSDLSVKNAGALQDLKLPDGDSRPGARPAIGGATEDSTSAATSRSETALSFRLAKRSHTDRVGVTLVSSKRGGVPLGGVMITHLQEGSSIEKAGANMGDRLVSINGEHVTSANKAADILKKAVGDVEVIVERSPALTA